MTRARVGGARRTAAVVLLLAACGGDRGPGGAAQGTSGAAMTAHGGAASGARAGGASAHCPHDGRWRVCSLLDRLDKAGLVPRVDSSAPPERLPFLHAPGTVVHLGLGDLHTFVYDDTAALTRDIAALDTTRVAPRGQSYAWATTPTFVRSANLVAVLLTPNERQIERIQLALDAGPPQPTPSAAK